MWKESEEETKPLRTGLTTGACATACSVAAAHALLFNQQPDVVSVSLPKGQVVDMTVTAYAAISDVALTTGMRVSTIKDAGDDPDATHGATVFVELTLSDAPGVTFLAAQGVGTVTRDGLELAVGEPAINPVPRKMITEHLMAIAHNANFTGGFCVAVGVEKGEQIALKTMNPRLGILGGLSILGTTGIVRPFSCAAWIASIHQGIDVAKANGITHIAATTGNTSEDAIKHFYQLDDIALIEMGDFAGAVLKHLRKVSAGELTVNKPAIDKLTICGGIGKISKLAQGHMDLNSRASSIDFEHLAHVAGLAGADEALQTLIKQSNTTIEALMHCQNQQIDLAKRLCDLALTVAKKVVPKHVAIEVIAVDRKGVFVGNTNPKVCNV